MHQATGTFDVKVKPEPLSDVAAKSELGRMSIDKVFHGGMDGTSTGEMLSWLDAAHTSGSYVAIERFTGTLAGKSGGFALQHLGTITKGAQDLSISIVPGSGTGELAGISGTFILTIAEGKHSYTLTYSLPR